MNKAGYLKKAEKYISLADDDKHSSVTMTYIELAKANIMMANATESMNVLTDKEMAQAKRNVELLQFAIDSCQEMIAFGGEAGAAGRVLFNRIAYG